MEAPFRVDDDGEIRFCHDWGLRLFHAGALPVQSNNRCAARRAQRQKRREMVMTCRPEPMNPLDALYQACRRYPGKLPALAHRVNMPEDTLRKKLRHQVETHILGYDEEVSEILDCLREAKVDGWADTIHAFCWRHGHLAIPIPRIDKSQDGGEEVTSAIVSSVKEHAEAIASIGESLSGDSVITDAELQRINKEIEEAMVALLDLRNLSTMLHDLAKMRGVVLPMQRKF